MLGNNGAGKSTLLRAMSGVLALQGGTVDAGTIRFDGADLCRHAIPADIVRAGIVQVPEGRRVFADLTVEENLRAGGLSIRGQARKAAGRATASSSSSRAWPSGATSAPACSRAASSRCSPSAAR